MRTRTLWKPLYGGMQTSPADGIYQKHKLHLIENARIRYDGVIVSRGGSVKLNATAVNSGAVFNALVWVPSRGLEAIVGGKMFTSGAGSGDIGYGYSWTDRGSVTTNGAHAATVGAVGGTDMRSFFGNGAKVYSWNGSSLTDISPAGASGINSVAYHNDRLWVGQSGKSVVLASKIGDPATWSSPDGLTLTVTTNDGDNVTGLGTAGHHLLVFKNRSVAYVDGQGDSDVIVASGSRGLSRNIGCRGNGTIANVGDDGVAWLSLRGIEYYSPGSGIQHVTSDIIPLINTLYNDNLPSAGWIAPVATYVPFFQEYWMLGSENGATDIIIRVNMRTGAVMKDTVNAVNVSSICVAHPHPTLAEVTEQLFPVIGSADGFAIEMLTDQTPLGGTGYVDAMTRSADDPPAFTGGTAITSKVRFAREDFGEPHVRKQGRVVRVASGGTPTISATLYRDSYVAAGTAQTLNFGSQGVNGIGRFSMRAMRDLGLELSWTASGAEIHSAELQAELQPRVTI